MGLDSLASMITGVGDHICHGVKVFSFEIMYFTSEMTFLGIEFVWRSLSCGCYCPRHDWPRTAETTKTLCCTG